MIRYLLFLAGLLVISAGCRKKEASPDYIRQAMVHCNCEERQLNWLKTIVSEKKYHTPGATLPAIISAVSLGQYNGEKVLMLDSPLSACFTCPWATLSCRGGSFSFEENQKAIRGAVIWKDR